MSETQQIAFVANEELLTVLSSLGISRNAATRVPYFFQINLKNKHKEKEKYT